MLVSSLKIQLKVKLFVGIFEFITVLLCLNAMNRVSEAISWLFIYNYGFVFAMVIKKSL